MEMLTINVSELVLTILNFFLLLFLLKRFLYTPIITFMDARNARIAEGLAQEAEALATVEEQARRHEVQLRESTDAAKRIRSQARAKQEENRVQEMAQARAQAAQHRREAHVQAQERSDAEHQLLTGQKDALARLLVQQLLQTGSGRSDE